VKDLLLFSADHAPNLDDWQRDIVHMVRSEALYFLPQMQTKIMNEGWAAYWHARIMRDLDLSPQEYVDFADMHAGVLAPSRRQINPYYLGMKIFEDIEKRWDAPGREDDGKPTRPGQQGRAKIFEVRSLESDVSFLRNYLTKDLVEDLDLFTYELKDDQWVITEKDWKKVRDSIVDSMTNFGRPYIVVCDADYDGNRELFLEHRADGKELDEQYAEKTLEYVYQLWGHTIHLSTPIEGKATILSYDGRRHDRRNAA
jgi:stage V sporulation protein R